MKKIFVSTMMMGSLLLAQGDFFEIRVGGGDSNFDIPTALAGDSSGDVVLNYDTQASQYRWAEFEHDIPLIPNVRVESATMDFTGEASSSGSFNGFPITVNTASTLDLKNKDLMLYWAMPFVDFSYMVDADFGLGAKQFDGLMVIEAITEEVIDQLTPYAFARFHVNSQEDGSGLGLEGLFKYATDGVAVFSEYVLKADYTVNVPLPFMDLSVGIEGGYRTLLIDTKSETSADYVYMEFAATFFGFVGKFGI